MSLRVAVVPGPGVDGRQCSRWGSELGIDVEVRHSDPVAALQGSGAGLAGVVIAPGRDGFGSPGLAAAVAAAGLPVVAVDPGNIRKAGVRPESSALAAAGACILYGRGEDTARHALLYISRRHDRPPDTLAYGPEVSQEGDLWVPPGPGPHPVAVLFHGGFWYHAWERDLMDGLARDLSRRGVAAWNVEYRRVGAGGNWPAIGEDAARATDHLLALGPVYDLDLGRVVTIGHSAGGQLALWVTARGRRGLVYPVLVVGLATIADLDEALAARTGGGSVARLFDAGDERGDDGDLEVAMADASPRARVPIGVPQILAHASGDPVVPVSQTTEYSATARAAGDDVTVLEFETGGHFELIDPDSPAWASVFRALEARL